MNKKNLIFAAVLCVALAFGFSACENPNNDDLLNQIEDLKNDKDKTESADKDGDKDNSSDNEQSGGDEGGSSSSVSGTENGHAYVDLGLPSGLRWATCNVGASSPEEYGNYYAWGEVEPKSTYDWSTYKWMTTGMSSWTGVNKYTSADNKTSGVWYDNSGNFIGDNKTILDQEDDAAFVNMGGSWRMPTKAEQDELRTECSWTWTTSNGVNGYNVEGPNGNSIFLPAAGYRSNSDLGGAGSGGDYWSSSLNTNRSDGAYYLSFDSDYVGWGFSSRCCGRSVRGVCP